VSYLAVFLSAFVAATLLPAQSEAVLSFYILSAPQTVFALILVATVGNVLGSVVNWIVGFYATRFQNRKWFPATPSQMQRAEKFYRKYGRYSLLLSWVPFIGDPITVIAGVLREPILSFLLLVTIAKSARYIALSLIVLEMI
jgi:membrane protein YqaA with SNARE-associated domain|tara:strand:+ start:778 stop:1203 length:426 start_codon:yes stop_codon:yes gene_type:complete